MHLGRQRTQTSEQTGFLDSLAEGSVWGREKQREGCGFWSYKQTTDAFILDLELRRLGPRVSLSAFSSNNRPFVVFCRTGIREALLCRTDLQNDMMEKMMDQRKRGS